LSLKVRITTNIILVTLFLITGCSSLWIPESEDTEESPRTEASVNTFTVSEQQISSPDLYSLQLHRRNSEHSAPIIRLGSSQQLTLRFDLIETGSRQFRIRITHHNPDWSRSVLAPEMYMDGFSEAFFGGGRASNSQRPSYRHYEYHFPNNQISFEESGNYMLHVEDFQSGDSLFSLPFFVHENQGEIISTLETIYAPRRDLRVLHQPGSHFIYPDFVEIPQFDLEFYFTQNQFWGRTQRAEHFDVTTPGRVFYEVSRNRSFIGDYEFRLLEIPELTQRGPGILDYQPGFVPPRLLLNIDIQGFTSAPASIPGSRFGTPVSNLEARYGDIYFNFQPDQPISENQEMYLVGDFNNWTLHDRNKLKYDESSDLWTVNTFIKEGSYSYKYVLIEDENIYDLALDDTFTRSQQEYITFVYYQDPVYRHYRLLQTNTFYSN
jgi:hypothetical protein